MESKAVAGVKELKELCEFLAMAVSAGQQMAADGSLSVGDAALAVNPLMALPAALSGITEVPAEVADLDPAEAAELTAAIKAKLDLTNDGVEEIAEKILDAALQLAAAALSVVNAKKAA